MGCGASSGNSEKTIGLKPTEQNSYTLFENAVAARLHQHWRETRRMPDGSFQPRIKIVDGVKYDIANLEFDDLPELFQYENRAAARVACRCVKDALVEASATATVYGDELINSTLNDEFVERAAEDTHIAWMKRNGKWAEEKFMVPYDDLSEEDKEKDRVIVREAIYLFKLGTVAPVTQMADKASEPRPLTAGSSMMLPTASLVS